MRLPRRNLPSLLIAATLLASGGCAGKPDLLRGKPRVEADVLRDVRQLTTGARFEDATDPEFSPDMKWLAFRATPVGEFAPQLYLAPVLYEGDDVAGLGNPVRITPLDSRNASPTFSPDGRSLAFVSTAGTGDPLRNKRPIGVGYESAAEVFRVDGWQRHVAAGDVRQGVDLAQHPITQNNRFDGEIAWSPTGGWIALTSDRDAPASAIDTSSLVDLYLLPADGRGDAIRLTDRPGTDGAGAWLPGGRAIVFESDTEAAGRYDLYRVDLTFNEQGQPNGGSAPRRLTEVNAAGNDSARQPTVHPEGDLIVYVARRGDDAKRGNSDLRQVRTDGRRDFPLTFGEAADDAPSFSPDGRFLVFSSRRAADGSRQLYVARYVRPRRS